MSARKVCFEMALAVAILGAAVVACGIVAGTLFWFTEIAPWHWRNGNVWPTLVPIACAAIIIGSAIAVGLEDGESE